MPDDWFNKTVREIVVLLPYGTEIYPWKMFYFDVINDLVANILINLQLARIDD